MGWVEKGEENTPKASAGGWKRVIREGPRMRSVYANATKVATSREEVNIFFGTTRAGYGNLKEAQVDLQELIVLSPFSAKRLAILLDHAIRDYESTYGPLGHESPSVAGADLYAPPPLPPCLGPGKPDEKAALIMSLVENLNVEVGFERSFKVLQKTLLADRFLLGFKRNTIRQKPNESIMHVCRQIHMPDDFLVAFYEKLPEANIVLFGFEESERGSLYKAYLEFGGRFEQVIKDNPDMPEPFLIHLGFKWDTADNSKRAMARYTCFPSFTVENMLERLSDVFYGQEYRGPYEITESVINLASNRIGHDRFLYLEVEEEGNPRRSFDINMYRANIRMEELYALLMKVCRHYDISYEEFGTMYEPIKNQIFGHLSGGIDRQGRDFLTVYFGVKGSSR